MRSNRLSARLFGKAVFRKPHHNEICADCRMQKKDGVWQSFLSDESGATMIEYAILAGMLSIVAVSTLASMGVNVESLYSDADQSFK